MMDLANMKSSAELYLESKKHNSFMFNCGYVVFLGDNFEIVEAWEHVTKDFYKRTDKRSPEMVAAAEQFGLLAEEETRELTKQ